ncbi:MAG TPA: hypothetical protein ENI08_00980 [Candidatus Dependentiae bacterium]|nr:hypothetical protein [Candidatus Dependentiae bacterium]
MINITIITTKGCQHCVNAKQILNSLKQEYPLSINEIDAASQEGQALIKKHNILLSPGILINDQFFSMGGSTREQFRKKFDKLK